MVKRALRILAAGALAGLRAIFAALSSCLSAAAAVVRYLRARPLRTKLKAAAAATASFLLVLTPFDKADPGVVLLPTDGTEITLPHTMLPGKLYKLTVRGTYVGASDGRRYDAEYVTQSDPFDTPRSSLVIDDRLVSADVRDKVNHRYTYYVAGRGRGARLRVVDRLTRAGPEGGYFDNEGFLEVTLEEADFRFYADDDATKQALATTFRYSLDPPPRPDDVVVLEIFARATGGREKVFEAASDGYVAPSAGFPLRLGRKPRNEFTWYGVANTGPKAYEPLPPGLYDVRISVKSGRDVFYAYPPDAKSQYLTVAVLPASSDPRRNPQPIIAQDDRGRNAFPYYSPRASHPILGPIEGVERIYVPGQTFAQPGFLYYSPLGAGPSARAGPRSPPAPSTTSSAP